MTQPPDPQLALLQQSMTTLTDSVKDLTRAIHGDTSTGSPSIRASIDQLRTELTGKLDKLKTELDSETNALNDRTEALEKRVHELELTLKIYMGVARWAGGGSLASLLALAGVLLKLFGGA